MNIALRGGLYWPEGDEACYKAALTQYRDLDKAIELCKNKRIAVQAGGNCGVFPRYLAQHFGWVYTFEPDVTNFRCLNQNVPEDNVIRLQAVLGNGRDPVGMRLSPDNVGAHRVMGIGVVPQMRIDDLGLLACDLIQLDIEGFEHNALKGAEQTILKHKPVLMLEDKGHCLRYGTSNNEFKAHLESLGYELKEKVNKDIIMVHKGV